MKLGAAFSIHDRLINLSQSPFCIAEVGINHNGSLTQAKEMVLVAKEAGADAVKFQTFSAREFCGDPNQVFTYQSQGRTVTESMLAMFERYELQRDDWFELKAFCDDAGILFLSTPQNRSDLNLLLDVGISAIKIGSDDLTNVPLIRDYARENLPLILSCGMADIGEVHNGLQAAGFYEGKQVALLLCTSQYPTPLEDVNLRKLETLRGAFPGLTVGFSDHTQGPLAAGVAVAFGASIFEKHFTMSHDLPGPDHWFSEDPEGLKEWIATIHNAYRALGSPLIMPTHAELDMRTLARRSIVILNSVKAGDILDESNVGLRRPGGGLPPAMISEVYGMRAAVDLEPGMKLHLKDLRS